ncbi:MAG TPA: electron transfer flavoprotein subunit beta/FixA family protein, partial [Desulfobacteria bacterium]|nr:electron transfer flavoprotein subunit beta/FixA family protein [Desulfobacteria bacterium]
MHCVVCLKQVPDTSEVRIDPKTNTLMREGVPSIINPYDAHALEEALAIRDKMGGKVTVVSMGPPQAVDSLRKAISLGADEAILLSDRAFAGSDTLATSYILARALEKIRAEQGLDLVLCGKQAIDGDTAQVGPGIARRLNLPQLTYVIKVEWVRNGEIQVQRKLEDGKEIAKAKLPALITVEKEINEIRYATFPNMLQGAKYQAVVWGTGQFNLDPAEMGLKGSPTSVSRIFAPPARTGGEQIMAIDDPGSAAISLVEKLFQQNVIMVHPAARGDRD